MQHIEEFMDAFSKTGRYPLFRQIERYGTNPTVVIEGDEYIMFASNNYLSLCNNKNVIESATNALNTNGLGPGGSRFLCGNIKILEELEREISDFAGVEDTITFPTGYMANMAAISALVGTFIGDQPHKVNSAVVFSDKNNHMTLVDGIRISKAKTVIYPHLDYEFLERELIKHEESHPKLIVAESVYSMDGNVADINLIHKLAKKHNAMLMIDDAHGIGILGETGGGALEHFKLKNKVDLIMGSFDKALGGMGGYLGGSKKLIKYLRIASRPYIFSSSIPAVMAGGLIESIKICRRDKKRRDRLMSNANYLRDKLKSLGFKILGNTKLPVLPILIGNDEKCKLYSEKLFERKIFAPAVIWPAVPENLARLRVTLMHDHEKEQLDYFAESLVKIRKVIDK
ncbi:aminotransferase class I/II-fold pyridoxal phosphate-dependent enzyme [Patescibacteria group bacterium]|nr:aminotransferase class I/II-fold pyridoxal phosphate-dependent enzyme [Patescibacteria group bacterium]MBU1952265.1 aminotransferase class I/II-fold pyridoxal phosphate-dependent enzyme [Patescibacteria group bacterium]